MRDNIERILRHARIDSESDVVYERITMRNPDRQARRRIVTVVPVYSPANLTPSTSTPNVGTQFTVTADIETYNENLTSTVPPGFPAPPDPAMIIVYLRANSTRPTDLFDVVAQSTRFSGTVTQFVMTFKFKSTVTPGTTVTIGVYNDYEGCDFDQKILVTAAAAHHGPGGPHGDNSNKVSTRGSRRKAQ